MMPPSRIPALPLLIPERSAIDKTLWSAYANVPPVASASSLLMPHSDQLAQERQRFHRSGDQYNPDVRPTSVDGAQIVSAQAGLYELKHRLPYLSSDDEVQAQYRYRINERIAELQIVSAATSENPSSMRRFRHMNQFVYGEPDRVVFAAAVDTIANRADSVLAERQGRIAQIAAEKVLMTLSPWRGDREYLVPDAATFATVRARHYDDFGHLSLILAGAQLPDQKKINEAIGNPLIQQVLKNMGSRHRLVLSHDRTAWGVDNQTETLNGPADYNLIRARFIGLVLLHEPTHILEWINGQRGSFRLTADGLHRYERGNEGRAVIREQIAYPDFQSFAKTKRWEDILRRHISTGLASGLAGERDFKSVYQVMLTIDRLLAYASKADDQPSPAIEQKASDRAWNQSIAVYKGTAGYGWPFGRGALYLEGTVGCWQEAVVDPTIIEYGDQGKFDIANPNHRAVIEKAGAAHPVKGKKSSGCYWE